jgi:hypothetical protein
VISPSQVLDNIAQAKFFDPKIMAQQSVFTENNFKFLDQNNMRARYHEIFAKRKKKGFRGVQLA